MQSRSKQWDHKTTTKVPKFMTTFEKKVFTFNVISQKAKQLDNLALMIILSRERQATFEMRVEMESREG